MGCRVCYPDESAITMLCAADTNPAEARRETFGLERHNGYDISLLRRDVNRIYDSFHGNIDPVWVRGTNVMTELVVTSSMLNRKVHSL